MSSPREPTGDSGRQDPTADWHPQQPDPQPTGQLPGDSRQWQPGAAADWQNQPGGSAGGWTFANSPQQGGGWQGYQPGGQQPAQPWSQQTGSQPAQGWSQQTGGWPHQPSGQPDGERGRQWAPQPAGQPTPQQFGQQQPTQQFGQQQPTQQFGQQPPTQQWGQQPPTQQWAQHPAGLHPDQWGQPANAQPWTPQAGQPWGQASQSSGLGQPPNKTNKGVLITAVAVVVALIAAFGVYWFALRDSSSAAGGKDTPREAAAQLFADIDNGDVLALADSFDPVEAAYFTDLGTDVIEHFKRLGLLTADAKVGASTGTTISIKGITFDDNAAEQPLDDLTIVKLTGGTITITPGDSSQDETDLFKRLKDALAKAGSGAGLPGQSAIEPTTIDIAKVIQDDNNGQPLRISTVLRDGQWYPSMFYTLADYWAQNNDLGPVTAADNIAAAGATSPESAVEGMIDAVSKQDARAIIQLLPPDEMAAVHAYGGKFVDAAGSPKSTGELSDFQAEWVTSAVTGGTLVSVKSVEFTVDGDHGRIDIDKDAGTATVSADGKTQTIDADTIAQELGAGDLSEIHPNMPDFVNRMLKAALGIGVVTTEVGGSWYVSIPRTFTGVFTTMLGGMQQQDIEMFIDLLNQ